MEIEEIRKYFYNFGENVSIGEHMRFMGTKGTYIGNNVCLCYGGLAAAHIDENAANVDKVTLKIMDNVYMNEYAFIDAFNYVEIGKYVLIGAKAYLADTWHEYNNFKVPIKLQGFKKNDNKIIIKDGAWIGSGSQILGNVTIGYGTVVGSNSVLKHDLPDHVVAVGSPARIVKICDYRTGEWVDVNNKEDVFLKILNNRGKFEGYQF